MKGTVSEVWSHRRWLDGPKMRCVQTQLVSAGGLTFGSSCRAVTHLHTFLCSSSFFLFVWESWLTLLWSFLPSCPDSVARGQVCFCVGEHTCITSSKTDLWRLGLSARRFHRMKKLHQVLLLSNHCVTHTHCSPVCVFDVGYWVHWGTSSELSFTVS